MDFQFALKQRVTVPLSEGVQGIVSARQEAVKGENQYHVCLLDEELERVCVVWDESKLIEAQPGPTVSLELANEMATKARDEAAKELLSAAARTVKPKGWRKAGKRRSRKAR